MFSHKRSPSAPSPEDVHDAVERGVGYLTNLQQHKSLKQDILMHLLSPHVHHPSLTGCLRPYMVREEQDTHSHMTHAQQRSPRKTHHRLWYSYEETSML